MVIVTNKHEQQATYEGEAIGHVNMAGVLVIHHPLIGVVSAYAPGQWLFFMNMNDPEGIFADDEDGEEAPTVN